MMILQHRRIMIALPSSGLTTHSTRLWYSSVHSLLFKSECTGEWTWMHVGLFTSTQVKCCCVSPPYLLSYHHWWFNEWGHRWGMMSSERRDCDATHLLASTVQDSVYLLVSSLYQLLYTQPHCSHWIYGGWISLFCCFLPPFWDRNQQVTGHPCLDESNDVVCVFILCLDTIMWW